MLSNFSHTRIGFNQIVKILLITFIMGYSSSYAQLIPMARYEKELKSSDNGFTIVSLRENGIALIREKNKFNEGKRLWEVILLDTALEEKWQNDLEIKSNHDMIGYEYAGQYVYFLFREGDKDSNKFGLVQIHINDFAVKQYEIKHEFSFRLTHFSVVGENAIFGGYISREPAVLLYETSSQFIKVIPGFFLKDTEMLDMTVNYNNTFNVLMIERNSMDKRHLVAKTFDQMGVLLLEDYIEIEKDKNILTGITSSLKREELIILGTYTEGVTTEALGYYAVLVDPFSEQKIQYYPFPSLGHLLDYLPEKRASRIKSRSIERIEQGKNPDYKAHVQPIRIEETDEGFYFLSEMYDPVASNPRPYWNNYYSPYYGYGYAPYSYNPFMNRYAYSPYDLNNMSESKSAKMIESVLTLFDEDGKLLWDNSLKFIDEKRYALEQTSDFIVKDKLAFIAYKKEQAIHVNTGSTNSESESDTLSIPQKHPSDIVRYETEEDAGIRYWFKDHLYAWGYQSLRDTERKEEDPIRYVFYISKFEAE